MKKLLFTVALGALVSTQAGAQAPAAQTPVAQTQPLTRQQAADRADRLFDMLDLNHDGILTRDEVMQAGRHLRAERLLTGRDVAPGIGGHTARYLERSFSSVESATKPQFRAALLAHFDKMDRDHDGVLTAEERHPGSGQNVAR